MRFWILSPRLFIVAESSIIVYLGNVCCDAPCTSVCALISLVLSFFNLHSPPSYRPVILLPIDICINSSQFLALSDAPSFGRGLRPIKQSSQNCKML